MTAEELLKEILEALSKSLNPAADPYSEDGSYAAAIGRLPIGLRAMAATHHLDVSLTLDDIGWHFLNFGEPALVRETEAGLRELELGDLAKYLRRRTISLTRSGQKSRKLRTITSASKRGD